MKLASRMHAAPPTFDFAPFGDPDRHLGVFASSRPPSVRPRLINDCREQSSCAQKDVLFPANCCAEEGEGEDRGRRCRPCKGATRG